MYTVYILHSRSLHQHYIGHAKNLSIRFKQHSAGKVRSTKRGVPWRIIYTEIYMTKHEAYKRERQIKSYKGGQAFKDLLTATADGGVPPEAA